MTAQQGPYDPDDEKELSKLLEIQAKTDQTAPKPPEPNKTEGMSETVLTESPQSVPAKESDS
jgi:hypothetical protein